MKTNQKNPKNNQAHTDERHGDAVSSTTYTQAFKDWMKDLQPNAFVTINLPHELNRRRVPRDAQFHLNLWTRAAEAKVLGPRTLKDADYNRRIVWLFRREVAPDGLVHYHGIAKFPAARAWRHESTSADLADRCGRLRDTLMRASRRTPEPYATSVIDRMRGADIDVRPFDGEHDHAGYLLKGLWTTAPDWVTDETTYDSGLIILPHLPKKGA